MSVLGVALDPARVIVAVDPGEVMNRVWVSNGLGLLEEPLSLPVARSGIEQLEALLAAHPAPARVIAVEATGSLHRAWAIELERTSPGRFKTDDRDCAALTYLARQGAGRRHEDESASRSTGSIEGPWAAVRHRHGLVADRRVAQQRMHDQLNALCPGLSVPDGNAQLGRALPVESPTGQAVLGCAVAFAGRAPSARSLVARAPGRLTRSTATTGSSVGATAYPHRPPPTDAEQRADRLGRDLARYRALQVDVAAAEEEIAVLLAGTDGQILTTLPGVAVIRAASFAAHSLPIEKFPDAEHLYSAPGLAPAIYQSATLSNRGPISRPNEPLDNTTRRVTTAQPGTLGHHPRPAPT